MDSKINADIYELEAIAARYQNHIVGSHAVLAAFEQVRKRLEESIDALQQLETVRQAWEATDEA